MRFSRHISTYIYTGIFILLLLQRATAQQHTYVYTHRTVEDGLRSNLVISLHCDSRGYMWVGTFNGLQCYDGVEFRFIDLPVKNGTVSGETVQRIYEDKKHKTLWFVMLTGVVAYNYQENTYKFYPVLHGRREGSVQISNIFCDSNDYLWLISTTDNAYIFDSTQKAFVLYTRFFPEAPGKINNVLEEKSTGRYIFGTSKGLCVYDPTSKQYSYFGHNLLKIPYLDEQPLSESVNHIYITQKGLLYINMWPIGSPEPFLYQYNIAGKRLRNMSYLKPNSVNGIFDDIYGKTWVVGDKMFLFDQAGNMVEEIVQAKVSRFGLDYSQLHYVTRDNMHNIWMATNNGIFIFNKEKQKFLTTHFGDAGAPNYEPTDIQEGPGKDIYVSCWGQGLLVYDSTLTRLKKQYRYTGSDEFFNLNWNLEPDGDGNIWVASQHGRYGILNTKTGIMRYERSDIFDNRTIRCLAKDTDGNIWMGTQRGLLIKWDIRKKQFTRYQDSLYHTPAPLWGHIMDIKGDAFNNIYVGTGSYGLLKMDARTGKITKRYGPDEPVNKLLSNGVNTVLIAGDTLFVGTTSGLSIIDIQTGKSTNYTEKEGLPVSVITNLQLANRNLFFTTNFSMGKINLDNRKVVNYGRKYGVVEEAFELPVNQRLSDGRIVIGSAKSLISFQPDALGDPQPPPNVHITSLQLGKQRLNADSILERSNTIQLAYEENSITIGYNSMAYLDQDNISYYYQLEGVDPNPVEAGHRVLVNYTGLPSGRHTFKVWSENGEGLTSPSVTSFTLVIARPYYRQWWFFGLILLTLGALSYLAYRLRINRLLATEKVRRRIARDLHDDMGSTLTSINIMTTVAKRHVQKDTDKTEEFLIKIGDSTTRMMESMDDIVWSINPNNDNMHMIVARMREFTTSMFEPKEIGFTFHVDEQVYNLKLTLESRHDFFMIFKESINNIAKHAQCSFVEIDIKYKKRVLVMQVTDNGQGFEQTTGDGDGLFNMQRRAQRMKGSLEIQSRPGNGTRICLRFTTT
ncbi:two-component regulator propeller domain-containing protein [uncultured Chitinophaga sp.]|uniref:two-component regulator propeller domain-containing protein n=1 Tax=uncultured Chitinophaga sp. TaxID=339340 RepID=UPI0025D2F4D3|nr:sensor histidine kinase [uncultured Chitinophaga sp.]